MTESELYHHGIKGQKWGVRRFQNEDGTLTSAGKKHVAEGKSGSFNSKGGTDLSQLGGSSGGGGGGGAPLDEEDQKKLDEDMERMKGLLEQRIADGDLEDHPLVEDDDDVSVIIYENGSDPDKMSKQQFDTYKRQLQEFDKYAHDRLAEARADKWHQDEKTHRRISPDYGKKAQSGTPSITSNLHKAPSKLKDAAGIIDKQIGDQYMERLGQTRRKLERDKRARQARHEAEANADAERRKEELRKHAEKNRAKHSYQVPSESELYHRYPFIQR